MTTPYSQDLRDRVLAAYDRQMRTKQISVIFAVSPSWARRVKQRRRETGETTHRPMGAPIVIKVDRARLAELVREHPDATLAELRELLGVQCALSTISEALKALGLSFKKNDPRGGTGSSRHCRTTGRMAFMVTRCRCRSSNLHRRNLGQNKHDQAARACTAWRTPGGQDAPRALEDNHTNRGVGPRRNPLRNRCRRSHQR